MSENGLQFEGEISFEQWREIGRKVGRAARASQFLVGDWLVYGQDRWNKGERFEKMPEEQAERYLAAMRETGLELRTLMDAAYVARNIPHEQRRPQLTFEHHKAVAKIKDEDDRADWLGKADTQGLSTRRLRKSIELGRVANESELRTEPSERGVDNHLKWIGGMVRWWKAFEESEWVKGATREQIEAMLADFDEVKGIISVLETAVEAKESVLAE